MSVEGRTWANKQRLKNPSAQIMLLIIGECADPEGVAFAWWKKHDHWWTYLVDKTRQSRATVFRRLNELEKLGLIVRVKIVHEDGLVTHQVRCDLERFVDLEADEIDPPENPDLPAPAGKSQSQIETGGQSQFETETEGRPSLTGETGSVSIVRLQESPDKNLKDSPQSPPEPQSGPSGEENEEKKQEASNDLSLFRAAYPEPSNRPHEVEAAVLSLSGPERAALIRGAQGVAAARKQNPRKAILDQVKFVRDPALWAEYGRLAPAQLPPAFFTDPGSDVDRAWSVYFRLLGYPIPVPRLREGEGRMVRFWPSPEPRCGLGYGRFADSNPDDWEIFDPKSANYVAWGERIKEWTGKWPVSQIVMLDGTETIRLPNGGSIEARKRRSGRRFPAPWPLNKAAAASPDAPAEGAVASFMTDDDQQALADEGGTR